MEKTVAPQLHSSDKVGDVLCVPVVQMCRCRGDSRLPQLQLFRNPSRFRTLQFFFVVDVPVVQVHLCVQSDKVVDMPVIVNDRLLHSGSAPDSVIAGDSGHSSCATQTGMSSLLMAAMIGFLTHFASFFALLRLSRS